MAQYYHIVGNLMSLLKFDILLCISSLLLNHFKLEKAHSKVAPCREENVDLE